MRLCSKVYLVAAVCGLLLLWPECLPRSCGWRRNNASRDKFNALLRLLVCCCKGPRLCVCSDLLGNFSVHFSTIMVCLLDAGSALHVLILSHLRSVFLADVYDLFY